jgi:hypothetical protein
LSFKDRNDFPLTFQPPLRILARMKSHNEESFIDEDLELERAEPRSPIAPVLMTAVFALLWMFAFLPMTRILGLARLYLTLGNGSRSLASVLITLPIFLLGLHAMLVFPVTQLAYPVLKRRFTTRALRILIVAGYLVPPLLAFGFYKGGINELMDVQELLLIVVPPAVIAALIFEASGAAWLVTAFLGVATWFSFYYMNDGLSGFDTFGSYYSVSAGFYYWRALAPISAVAMAVVSLGGDPRETVTLKGFEVGLVAVLIYFVLNKVAFPIGYAAYRHVALTTFFTPSFDWVFIAATALLLRRRNIYTYGLLVGLGAGQAIYYAVQLIQYARALESTFWDVSTFCYLVTVFFLFAWMTFSLVKPHNRETFRIKYVPV